MKSGSQTEITVKHELLIIPGTVYTKHFIYIIIYAHFLVNVLLKPVLIRAWKLTVSTCLYNIVSMHLNVLELVPL